MTLDVHQHPGQRRLKAFSSTLCPIIEEMLASSDQIDHNVGARAASCSISAGWNTAGVGRFARRICKTVHLPSKSLNSITVWKEISRGFKYLNYHLCGQKVNVSYFNKSFWRRGGGVNWEDKKNSHFTHEVSGVLLFKHLWLLIPITSCWLNVFPSYLSFFFFLKVPLTEMLGRVQENIINQGG